jgi:hypothetical protein
MIQVIFMDFDQIETYSGLVHQLSLQPMGQAFTGHFPMGNFGMTTWHAAQPSSLT